MSQKDKVKNLSNCQMATRTVVIATADSTPNVPNVPRQKRKEDAKEILYLNRV